MDHPVPTSDNHLQTNWYKVSLKSKYMKKFGYTKWPHAFFGRSEFTLIEFASPHPIEHDANTFSAISIKKIEQTYWKFPREKWNRFVSRPVMDAILFDSYQIHTISAKIFVDENSVRFKVVFHFKQNKWNLIWCVIFRSTL